MAMATMTLTNLVSVERATTRARQRTYARAFLPRRSSTYGSAGSRGGSHRKFVTMSLPKRPFMTTNAMTRHGLRGNIWLKRDNWLHRKRQS